MAGSINLSLSQQFDKLNGNLLSGGRLYFYAAGTDNPQNAFKDTGLTLTHPNPIILASDGRVPQLYFADGSIHVRLTDNAGVVQFDEDFVLVVGPSSGGGGGGGSSVDPNAIFQTGMMDWQPIQGERSGWVRCHGGTIGNSSSGADYFAPACQALYEHLFASYTDAVCPLSSGVRSSTNAAAAYAAATKITLLDMREIIAGGLSNMGKADLGNFANIPHERGDQKTPASIVGTVVHTLTAIDTPTHSHPGSQTADNNADHTHQANTIPFTDGKVGGNSAGGPGGNIWYGNVQSPTTTTGASQPHQHPFTANSFGGNQPHNNTPRIMLGTFYMRL